MSKTLAPITSNLPARVDLATLRQDRRLSTFCSLAAEQPDEARANLPASLRDALPALIDDAAARCEPVPDDALAVELTKTLALGMGGPMSPAERQEWQLAMTEELRDIPADLALEGLRLARRSCSRASEVLPFIVRHVEDYPARRRAALARLITLADVVGVDC